MGYYWPKLNSSLPRFYFPVGVSQGNRRVAWIYNARTTKKTRKFKQGEGWGGWCGSLWTQITGLLGGAKKKEWGQCNGAARRPKRPLFLLFSWLRSGCHPGPASTPVPGVLPYWPWRARICAKCIFFLRRAFVTLRTTYDTVSWTSSKIKSTVTSR